MNSRHYKCTAIPGSLAFLLASARLECPRFHRTGKSSRRPCFQVPLLCDSHLTACGRAASNGSTLGAPKPEVQVSTAIAESSRRSTMYQLEHYQKQSRSLWCNSLTDACVQRKSMDLLRLIITDRPEAYLQSLLNNHDSVEAARDRTVNVVHPTVLRRQLCDFILMLKTIKLQG